MKNNKYDEKTFCQAFDERCNGCIYEARWNLLISKSPKEYGDAVRQMNALDPVECADMGMEWKDTK